MKALVALVAPPTPCYSFRRSPQCGHSMNEQRPAASLQRFFGAPLAETDPELAEVLSAELIREQDGIELIASENVVSAAVLEAQGSVLTNKYAEGYPGRRYYGGCVHVDVAENLAIERAKRLFACHYANVQSHSGAQANQAKSRLARSMPRFSATSTWTQPP